MRTTVNGVDLTREDLSGVDLSFADLLGVNLSNADLSNADLSGADLSDASLIGANLRYANLRYANLSSANLSGANLFNVDLHGTNLSDANLCNTNLHNVNLTRSIMSRVSLQKEIPVVANIDAAILAAIEAPGNALDMSSWHTCKTTHCRAGWAITLAGEAGAALENELGPATAGALIYGISRPDKPVPDFCISTAAALFDLQACAEECRNNT
jgi:uncharacterized protein YjbI with pentapeptide repeats